jgi:D-amino peptidase
MRALISADMEGVTGVTWPDDCIPGTAAYARFQPIFTGDVNAVALGLFDAGVDEVLVTEAHGHMRNILLEQLDPRVQMVTGRHKTYPMLEGIQDQPDLVAFVGYHSAAGTGGVLSHTFVGSQMTSCHLNGRLLSEGYLNALLCAEFGGRLAVVAGDDITCADAGDYAPAAQHGIVKYAIDRHTARCLSPEATSSLLRAAAKASVTTAEVPQLPEPPYTCELEFSTTNCARAAAVLPGNERIDDRTIRFSHTTMDETYRWFAATVQLATQAVERIYG